MRKRLVGTLIVAVLVFCFATRAYAGSSTLRFSGGSGSVLIITTAPGVTGASLEVDGGGSFRAFQYLSTSSSTIIVREGEFWGGEGFVAVVTNTTDPEVKFGAYLSSDNSGYLGHSVATGSSVEFQLSAQGSGSGNLEVFADTGQRLDCGFILTYDATMMNFSADSKPFSLSWITFFDNDVTIDGGAGTY